MSSKEAIRTAALSAVLSMSTFCPTAAPMTISGLPPASVTVGERYRFLPIVKHADAEQLQFIYYNLPSFSKHYRSCGLITGVPKEPAVYSGIRIGAWDGRHYAVLPPFAITVKAAAPTAKSPAPMRIEGTPGATAVIGAYYSFTPTVITASGSTLTYAIANKPPWADFSAKTGALTGIPASGAAAVDRDIVLWVSDGAGTASLPPFSIEVSPSIGKARGGAGMAYVTWTKPILNTDGSAVTDLAGYRIRYGTSALQLDRGVSIGPGTASAALIENLAPGTWYFAVAAINSGARWSAYSGVAHDAIQ